MKFEVTDQHNTVAMHTESPEAVYEEQELKELAKAGYRFRLDGKSATIQRVLNAFSAPAPTSGTRSKEHNKKLF